MATIVLCSVNDKEARAECVEQWCAAMQSMSGTKDGAVWKPTWELVGGYKRGVSTDNRWAKYQVLTAQEYVTKYWEMLNSRKPAIDQWLEALPKGDVKVALMCYCPSVRWPNYTFCHLDAIEVWLFHIYSKRIKTERR